MNKKSHKFRAVLIFIMFSLAVVFTACKTEDVTKRAENEEKVLKAMIEYPGDGLYDPVVTVIGIGVDEPSEEELAAAEPHGHTGERREERVVETAAVAKPIALAVEFQAGRQGDCVFRL